MFYVRKGRVVGRKGLIVDKVEDVETPALIARIVELLADPFATGFYERLGARHVGDVRAPMPGKRRRMLPRYEFDLRIMPPD